MNKQQRFENWLLYGEGNGEDALHDIMVGGSPEVRLPKIYRRKI